MATTSFDKASIDARVAKDKEEAAKRVDQAAATPGAVIVVDAPTPRTLAVSHDEDHSAGADADGSDILVPYISLIQKTSDLIDEIPGLRPSAFVFNKSIILAQDNKTPIPVVIANIDKCWEEVVPYESESRPRIFKDLASARAEGFDEDYGCAQQVMRRADFTFLIEAPEGLNEVDATMFPFSIDGKNYSLAKFTARKGAYTPTAKVVYTLLKLGKFMNRGEVRKYHYGTFELGSVLKSNAKNSWYAPTLKSLRATSDAVVAFLDSFLGGTV